MGQYFEITYSPSVWGGGYGGLHVQAPENLIAPQFSPSMQNVILRNSEIRSRPRFISYLPNPDTGVSAPSFGIASFFSRGSVFHTIARRQDGALVQLQPNSAALVAQGLDPWTVINAGAFVPTLPMYAQSFRGIIYTAHGGYANIGAWDGAAAAELPTIAFSGAVIPPVGGQTTFGAKFIGSLDSHLILAYTTENTIGVGTTSFPQRIRWSNTGFDPFGAGAFGSNLGTGGATFDPAISINAGLADFLEVPDVITGMMMMGRVGFILRSNGITEMSPTGQGNAPFTFNHLWGSEHGVGNLYPYAWAQYGTLGVLISTEQIYSFQAGGLTPIGGGARDSIMFDLSTATGAPKAFLTPIYSLSFTYLTYHLFIPQRNDTRVYVYSFEDNNWTTFLLKGVNPIAMPNLVYTGNPVVVVPPSPVQETPASTPAPTNPSSTPTASPTPNPTSSTPTSGTSTSAPNSVSDNLYTRQVSGARYIYG